MKKAKHIILWTLVIAYLIVGFGFVTQKQQALICNKVEVHIVDSIKRGFVVKKNITHLLQSKNWNLIGKTFNQIDLKALENVLDSYPPIKSASVYKTVDGRVVIDVEQRVPIVRIIDSNNNSYYIDENGYVMQWSPNYTANVIIANGNIATHFPISNKINVLQLEQKTQGKRLIQADLYKLAKYVNNNKFWNAQIQQIFVNFSGDFELIPRVGADVIIFGSYNNCDEKFSNLMSLYMHGLPAVGWNKYKTINLKFKGQVVCTKR